jgi:xanthine dehydrogenase accessory factor
MPPDFNTRLIDLLNGDEPFAVATVVRAEKPTSATAGSKALITADGGLTGWVGGSCAEPVVRREALKALQDGDPRLIRICPPENLGTAPQEGVIEIPLTCISGGTLEIYIEPQLAQPRLVVVGHLATAQALANLAPGGGFRVSVMGLEVSKERFPAAAEAFDRLDFSRLKIAPNTFVVVASHGNYDEDMLVAALASPARYVALVASKKRGAAILEYLHESDLTPEQISRLKYPAGLDLGARTPAEIAVSILAEMIEFRRRGPGSADPGEPAATAAGEPAEAIDPVCKMTVEIATARFVSEYGGRTYYFCAAGCKRSFDADPERYLTQETGRVG